MIDALSNFLATGVQVRLLRGAVPASSRVGGVTETFEMARVNSMRMIVSVLVLAGNAVRAMRSTRMASIVPSLIESMLLEQKEKLNLRVRRKLKLRLQPVQKVLLRTMWAKSEVDVRRIRFF